MVCGTGTCDQMKRLQVDDVFDKTNNAGVHTTITHLF